jgi:hypothetical protein
LPPDSRLFEGRVNRIEQLFLVKWFVQKSHRASVKGYGSLSVISMRGDKDDRYVRVGPSHLTLELGSAHARHAHVENQATRLMHLVRIQERSAEEKPCARNPVDRIRFSSEFLSASSSSTIEMSGISGI